jgi:hypothetical protein
VAISLYNFILLIFFCHFDFGADRALSRNKKRSSTLAVPREIPVRNPVTRLREEVNLECIHCHVGL